VGERRDFAVAIVGLGGLGSSAAYWAAKRAGGGVLGLERFAFGHERGASQDHSRIIRLSYHTPRYVRFAKDAYAAWSALERDVGERVVVGTGGIDLYPGSAYRLADDYTRALDEEGVGYEWMDAPEAMRRWPQWRLTDDVRVMFQADAGIVAAAVGNAAHRRASTELGAILIDETPVATVLPAADGYILVTGSGIEYRAERLILTPDAWTNDLLAQLWHPINLTVTQEQVHYYRSADLEAFAPERFPIWIWMGEPSFYGFPVFGERGPKIGQDVGGRVVTGDTRTFEPDPAYAERLDGFMRDHLPEGFGPYLARKTCLYTMTPDRDFVLDLIPGHEHAAIGQGAAHGFKFASVFGKSLVELAFDGKTESDVSAWIIDRPVLTMSDPPTSFAI
jgi:sarcosine oxidase